MRSENHPLDEMQALMRRMRAELQMQRRRPSARSGAWQPPLDLRASDDAYVVAIDLPGARREQIEATAEDGVLLVRGEVGMPEGLGEARRMRGERALGRFARAVRLPSDADMRAIEAAFSDGVLRVRVGRRPVGGRITIEIGS